MISQLLHRAPKAPSGLGIRREAESIVKACSYTSACVTPDGHTLYAVGSDKTIKEIVDGQITKEFNADTVLTQLAISNSGRMLFAGTIIGSIRAIKFPWDVGQEEFHEHHAHGASVSKLCISRDDQFLFSISSDGCLFMFKIFEKDFKAFKKDREVVYADEILVTKSDLEEKNASMAELKARVEELKMENEYQLRLKDMNFNEKIKQVTDKYLQEIETMKITSSVLKSEKEMEDIRHEEEMEEENIRHERESKELENSQNIKLMSEYEKYQELQIKLRKSRSSTNNRCVICKRIRAQL